MAATITIPNVSEPLRTLSDWLSEPETLLWMEETAASITAAIEHSVAEDNTLRVPRQAAERADGFRVWLSRYDGDKLNALLRGYRFQMAVQFEQEFERRFPSTYSRMQNRTVIRDAFVKLVWPGLENQFRDRAHQTLMVYAVRGIALSFVSRKIGDNLAIGIPLRNQTGWSVAVLLGEARAHISDVLLDRDGNVLTEADDLRKQVDSAPA